MFTRARSFISYANVTATLALFVALGGTGYALVVNGAVVQDESLTGADVMNGSLTGADVGGDSLTGEDIVESSLGAFPVRGYALSPQQSDTGGDSLIARADCPAGKKAVGGRAFGNHNAPIPGGGTSISAASFSVFSFGPTSDGSGFAVGADFTKPLQSGETNKLIVAAVCVDTG